MPESSKSDLTILKPHEHCCELNAAVFKYMGNLQFGVCNDNFLSARLHKTQSELRQN